MADLIDRTALLEELDWLHEVVNRCNRPSIKELIDRVKAQPTVEPKKGKWVKYSGDIAKHPYHCSECWWSDLKINRYRVKNFNYCPNCGADMRGDTE